MRAIIRALVAVLLLIAVGPGVGLAQVTEAPIRIAASANEPFAQAWFAQDLDLFKKAGLNVDVQLIGTGSAISAAVVGGTIDVGIATTVNLANAIAHGVPLVMIAEGPLTTPSAPSGLVCVAKSSPVRTAKDLVGQTVAVPGLKQVNDLATRVWLTRNGVDLTKVSIVESPFQVMEASLDRGTYQAAALSEPWLTAAVRRGTVRCIADPFAVIAPRYSVGVWMATTQFVQRNPDVVRRLSQVFAEAARWANTHHAESAAIISRISKIDVETIRSAPRAVFGEQVRASDLTPLLDAAYKYGFLSRAVSAQELIRGGSP